MDPITLILLLAGVAATIGGTVTSAAVNRQNQVDTNNMQRDLTRETNAQNVELAQLQHQWDIDMWNMQNAYNSPSAQMQRFRQAGLNPSLMYGSGTGIMNESAPAAVAPNMAGMLKTPQLHSLMQNLDFGGSSLLQSASDVALTDSQARLNNAQASQIEDKLPHEVQVLKDTSAQLRAEIASINQSVQESSRRIQSMDFDDQLKAAQKVRIEFQSRLDSMNFDLARQEFEQNVKESRSRIRLNDAQRSNFEAITRISNREYREMLATWKARLDGFDLENERIRQALNLGDVEIDNATKNGQLLGFQIDSGRISNVLDQEQYDDLSGKNGLYHYYKTKLNLKLSRDLKSLGDSGRLLFRIGK